MESQVRLRTGDDVDRSLFEKIYLRLFLLMTVEISVFLELVTVCRDANYTIPSPDTRNRLRAHEALNADGQVNPDFRTVVCAAVEGDGLHMRLLSLQECLEQR